MSRINFSAIVQRREVINLKGQKQELKKLGWQRCYIQLQGDFLRIWNAGGILLGNNEEIDELQKNVEPIDAFHLRMVHIQKIPDKNCLCLHFTKGMERILLCPETSDEGRTIETWASIFQRSLRDAIILDQYHTSVFLHTYKCDDILSYVHKSPKGIFDDSFAIECKWPGMTDYFRSTLTIKMRPGWKDCRVVSKRCISLTKENGSNKKLLATISPVTSFHMLSEADGIVIIEGDGRFHVNDSKIVPITTKVQVRTLQVDDLKPFMLFLRDAFEIILPRPNLFDESETSAGFQKICVDETVSKNDKSESESLSSLVQSQPWNQLPWSDLYSYYKLKNFKYSSLSPSEFTLKFKSFGFCLKSSDGSIVTSQQLQKIFEHSNEEAEMKNIFAPMYWHHLALKHM